MHVPPFSVLLSQGHCWHPDWSGHCVWVHDKNRSLSRQTPHHIEQQFSKCAPQASITWNFIRNANSQRWIRSSADGPSSMLNKPFEELLCTLKCENQWCRTRTRSLDFSFSLLWEATSQPGLTWSNLHLEAVVLVAVWRTVSEGVCQVRVGDVRVWLETPGS